MMEMSRYQPLCQFIGWLVTTTHGEKVFCWQGIRGLAKSIYFSGATFQMDMACHLNISLSIVILQFYHLSRLILISPHPCQSDDKLG